MKKRYDSAGFNVTVVDLPFVVVKGLRAGGQSNSNSMVLLNCQCNIWNINRSNEIKRKGYFCLLILVHLNVSPKE